MERHYTINAILRNSVKKVLHSFVRFMHTAVMPAKRDMAAKAPRMQAWRAVWSQLQAA